MLIIFNLRKRKKSQGHKPNEWVIKAKHEPFLFPNRMSQSGIYVLRRCHEEVVMILAVLQHIIFVYVACD